VGGEYPLPRLRDHDSDLLLAARPWLAYRLYPPTVTRSPEVPTWARAELAKLGAIFGLFDLVVFLGVGLPLILWGR